MSISVKDKTALIEQLGRIPRGVIEITNYTDKGKPLVIKTNPIIELRVTGNELREKPGKQQYKTRNANHEPRLLPFPTLFYLTHPQTVKAVARLEDESLLKELQALLQTDKKMAKTFQKAQRDYIAERLSVVGDKIKKVNKETQKVIKEKGIGGVKDLTKVKCLHAHYAHYLARGRNPVGLFVHKRLNEKSRN